MNRQLSKEDTVNKNMKKRSPSLIIRDMHIETTIRYHLTLARIPIILKSPKIIDVGVMWQKGNRSKTSLKQECKLVQPLWKTVWRILQELKKELPFNPAIPLLGIYPKEYKSFCHKDTCTQMFIAALFMVSKT